METQGANEKADLEAALKNEVPPPTYGANVDEPPPPSYQDAPKDAPPSYQQLFGQMKEAKQNSSGVIDFIRKVIQLLLNTIAVTIFMAIMLAIPIAMVVIGAMYKDDCPVERMIPIYLIVAGTFYMTKSILDLIQRWISQEDEDNRHEHSTVNSLSRLIGCFLFGFFIAGNVWIYSNFPPDIIDDGSGDYCNPVVYYFAFWITTLVYIFSAFTCICICCAALGAVATSSS